MIWKRRELDLPLASLRMYWSPTSWWRAYIRTVFVNDFAHFTFDV
jgi:hypothetical protein